MEAMRLNVFQRCMRLWEQAHPYNAAQILRIEGPADIDRLRAAWDQALGAAGLGRVRVEANRFWYEAGTGQADAVRVVDSRLGLETLISEQLNRPFGDAGAPYCPFRPFVIEGDGQHHFGVFYQHWVADSVSMRMLLREWFLRVHHPTLARNAPLRMPDGGYWHYFGPPRGGWNLGDGLLWLLRSAAQFTNARRLPANCGPQQVRCSLHRLPDGNIDELRQFARRHGITLNDIFLAALARACHRHGTWATEESSKDLAVGTIVDLRPTARDNMEDTFGMFLGFTTVTVRSPLLRDNPRLLKVIAQAGARQKRCRASQTSMLRMAVGLAQARFLSQEGRTAFYRKYMPVAGGISNVNMSVSWAERYHPSPLLEYIRVAPTGPMVPLVVAVTTLGKRCNFVLTRRSSLVDDARGTLLARTFLDELTGWIKPG